jgi:hypothetical protein
MPLDAPAQVSNLLGEEVVELAALQTVGQYDVLKMVQLVTVKTEMAQCDPPVDFR